MDTFATCFVLFRLNPERYKYKLFINKVTHMDLIITQSLCFILFLFINSLYLYLSGLSLKRTKHVAKVSITNEFLPNYDNCEIFKLFQHCRNQLVPVAIASFRYLLVCHPIFCQNKTEKKVISGHLITTLIRFIMEYEITRVDIRCDRRFPEK